MPVGILRPFNTYGPRQSARAVIPTLITQLATNPEAKLGSVSPDARLHLRRRHRVGLLGRRDQRQNHRTDDKPWRRL
ncbi:MAG: hypothetical protein ACKOFM_03250 [Actinomycetota bacterium]